LFQVNDNGSVRADEGVSHVFMILWLVAWIAPVVVLFSKGQTAWAVTGLLLGWTLPIIWIVAAIATTNRNKAALEQRRHGETLAAMAGGEHPEHGSTAPTIEARLATLDRLQADGAITAEEYATRRQEILREI
jgi:hypothetical protein